MDVDGGSWFLMSSFLCCFVRFNTVCADSFKHSKQHPHLESLESHSSSASMLKDRRKREVETEERGSGRAILQGELLSVSLVKNLPTTWWSLLLKDFRAPSTPTVSRNWQPLKTDKHSSDAKLSTTAPIKLTNSKVPLTRTQSVVSLCLTNDSRFSPRTLYTYSIFISVIYSNLLFCTLYIYIFYIQVIHQSICLFYLPKKKTNKSHPPASDRALRRGRKLGDLLTPFTGGWGAKKRKAS